MTGNYNRELFDGDILSNIFYLLTSSVCILIQFNFVIYILTSLYLTIPKQNDKKRLKEKYIESLSVMINYKELTHSLLVILLEPFIKCPFNFEFSSEILHVSWRKIQSHLNFVTSLFTQTDIFRQSFSLCFCPTVVFDFKVQIQ